MEIRHAVTSDVDPGLLTAMTDLGHRLAGAGSHEVRVLAARGESVVVRVGPVVVKAHHAGTDPAALAIRVALAAGPELAGILLPPLVPEPQLHAGRWLTAWPFGRTVDPDPDRAPWVASARLLARLHAVSPDARLHAVPADARLHAVPADAGWHAVPADARLPSAGGPARVTRSVAALAPFDGDPDARAVRDAWRTLPGWVRDQAPAPGSLRLTHGDWHFGQLIADRAGRWLLGDVDDLGLGDPLWDLGRPAAFRAIGVVTAAEFSGFLDEYRAAGGPLDAGPDPWPALDVPARAYTVQTAARTLLAARRGGTPPDDVTRELLAACRRMAATVP